MSSPSRVSPTGGTPPLDTPSAHAAAWNPSTAPQPQHPTLAQLPLRQRGATAGTAPHAAGTDRIRQPAWLSDEAALMLHPLYKKKQTTVIVVLQMFRENVRIPAREAWAALNDIHEGVLDAHDEQAAELVNRARAGAQRFLETVDKLFSQLRADDRSRGLSNNAKQILLKQAADAEEKIRGFVSTTEFITSSREALNALRLASRPLLDEQMQLEPDASLETLLALLNELEHKNICAQARERLSAQNTPSQNPTDCYRPFDVFYSRQLFALIEPAMWLQSQWVHAAATRLKDEYIDALKADPARVLTSQEKAESLLRYSERKLPEALVYWRRQVQCIVDRVDFFNAMMRHPAADEAIRQAAKANVESSRSSHVAVLIGMARMLTSALLKLKIVAPSLNAEDGRASWQQEMYGRIERLSGDVCSCYDGDAGLSFYLTKKVAPPDIRLDVMALIAGTAFSVTTDLEHIEANLGSTKRDGTQAHGHTLAMVQQLRQVIVQLEESLTGQIDEATRALHEGVRASKPYEREAAKRAMTKALEFATEHLNSFSTPEYEAPPASTQELAKENRPASNARALAHKEKQAAALKARMARDVIQESHAILQRLTTLEDQVLPNFGKDLAQADAVIMAMEAQLKAPGDTPMSADAIGMRLKGAASHCETAIGHMQRWLDTLEGDADYVRTEKPSDPAFDTLGERLAAAKRATDVLLAKLKEKASGLLHEADSMRLARQATMFVKKPTWSGYRILRGNDCIESVVKASDRFQTAHKSGNDYVQEYVIRLKTPSKLAELLTDGGPAPSPAYRAVVHVHYNGKDATDPCACHFKTWDQRRMRNSDSGEDVHYGKLTAMAAKLIDDLEAAVKEAPQRQRATQSGGSADAVASARKRKNKGKRK
jgi:hypothetical protein